MASEYWRMKRSKILPWVKDWTSDQNHIRHKYNVNKLSQRDWFWLHPTAYKLISFGGDTIGCLICIIFVCIFFKYGNGIAIFISLALLLLFLYNLTKKIKSRRFMKDFTFYDLYLRD